MASNVRLMKRAMKELGIDDTELAKRSGIHVTLIRRYLDGEVEVGVKNAPKLAGALELSVGSVLYGESEAKAS